MSLASLIRSLEEVFRGSGVPSPRVDAEILAAHVLGLSRTDVHLGGGMEVSRADEERIRALARRRAARYPLQYLTGECEFHSLAFLVREGVFIPRPETEVLVEAVACRLEAGGRRPRNLLEIGTGTGVICISPARALGWNAAGTGGPRVVATDISFEAVETAALNAAKHGVENLMQFAVGDGIGFLKGVGGGEGFDVFVCNPPYVAASEIAGLQPEVRDHEPRAALDGGKDGLEFMRRIIPALPSILAGGALAAFETAPDQAGAVTRLLREAGALETEVVRDLSGRDRVTIARMA